MVNFLIDGIVKYKFPSNKSSKCLKVSFEQLLTLFQSKIFNFKFYQFPLSQTFFRVIFQIHSAISWKHWLYFAHANKSWSSISVLSTHSSLEGRELNVIGIHL